MKISTSLTAVEAQRYFASNTSETIDICLVIDVLRATSVMATALAAGASRITTVSSVGSARQIACQSDPRPLLCGERSCQRIQGFDCGNSPAEYKASAVASKRLVLTTTNGTRAIEAASAATSLLAVSFLNLSATLHRIENCNRLHIICAGTNDHVSREDVLLAGAIVRDLLDSKPRLVICDSSKLAQSAWRQVFPTTSIHPNNDRLPIRCDVLARELRDTLGGRNLIELGFGDDLVRCAQIDSRAVVVERIARNPSAFVGR